MTPAREADRSPRPGKSHADARLLAEYLEYAGAGGTPMAAAGAGTANPFEASVRSRLAEYGITVVPQYGVGGYRVDFAAAHPDDPSRMILALEADGASYRDSGSVRDRDRLRKEHLERLGWRFHRLWSTNWVPRPRRRGGQAPRGLRPSRRRLAPTRPRPRVGRIRRACHARRASGAPRKRRRPPAVRAPESRPAGLA